jgi:type IV pilus assembly protein PilM
MLLSRQNKSVVGLDIEPGFVAAAEFSNGGSPQLVRAATQALQPGLFHDGEVVEVDGLAEQLKAFFQQQKLSKRVRLGVANQRIAVRVLELPAIDDAQEIESAVRFQAQEELPMPLEQAVLDHQVVERFGEGSDQRMRVLVVAVRRDTVEHLLAATRKAGLTPELIDLSAFAIVRALYVPSDEAVPVRDSEVFDETAEQGPLHGSKGSDGATGTLYCYVGGITNLAIALGPTCVFNRVLPNGFESMAAALAERSGLTLEHARQWLTHVGLERELENIEGDPEIVNEARVVLSNGARRIADEVRLSLEYYASAVPDARRVERVVLAGPGIAIAGLTTALEQELGLSVEARSLGRIEVRPGALDETDGARLTVAAGLALDGVAS